MDKQVFAKATIYICGPFGYSRREVKEGSVQVKPYAQYTDAVHLTFKEPRQRHTRSWVEGYRPNVVILEGWGHLTTASPFEEVGPGVSQTKYASFDDHYKVDFSEKLEKYLKDNPQVKVIADFRDG